MELSKTIYVWILPILLLFSNCKEQPKQVKMSNYYSAEDFSSILKYDTHVHLNTLDPALINLAKELKFQLLSLNVGAPDYLPLKQQQEIAMVHRKNFPDHVAYATSFDIKNFEDPNWQQVTLSYLRESFANGAIGVKVWKNIGMEYKKKDGSFLMIDDPKFDTIINYIQQQNKTLVGHLGEPRNCWLPLAEMTVKNDREYFENHPEYHMYLHPEFPSYEDQVKARDQMLLKHPGVLFDGAHLGSLEWSLDEMAKSLDKFPNMAIDMAERISHLQYQAIKNHKKLYDFFIKYQDRLLYATDIVFDDITDKKQALKYAKDTWANHWKFFTSDETMTAPELTESFKALHLPKEVVDKIYRINAEKWFPGFPTKKQL